MGPPRGMLMHITMLIIREGPMSGSELMEEIEKYSDWKPSPGSIYPMLAKLQEDGLIEPQADQDPSLKRFKLTEEGRTVLDEHLLFDEQFKRRNKTIRKIYWRLLRQMPEELYKTLADFLDQIEDTYQSMEENQENQHKFSKILKDGAKNLEKMVSQLDE
jgi:DNA-binding PadR family transcriptional regulator